MKLTKQSIKKVINENIEKTIENKIDERKNINLNDDEFNYLFSLKDKKYGYGVSFDRLFDILSLRNPMGYSDRIWNNLVKELRIINLENNRNFKDGMIKPLKFDFDE